jgi:hypothetical protein
MEQTSGETALTLVTLVMAQLQNRGLIDLEHVEQALHMLIDGPLTGGRINNAEHALEVVQRLRTF